jgi:hypothetical protein
MRRAPKGAFLQILSNYAEQKNFDDARELTYKGRVVKFSARFRAIILAAKAEIDGGNEDFDVRGFRNWVGSTVSANAILEGDIHRMYQLYYKAIEYISRELGGEDGEIFEAEAWAALKADTAEFLKLCPKERAVVRKFFKDLLSSKVAQNTTSETAENPCTFVSSEVVKAERVEGKCPRENVRGRKKTEIRREFIIDMLRKLPKMTEAELAAKLDCNVRTIVRDIAHLEAIGLLHREGTDFDGRWRVTKE